MQSTMSAAANKQSMCFLQKANKRTNTANIPRNNCFLAFSLHHLLLEMQDGRAFSHSGLASEMAVGEIVITPDNWFTGTKFNWDFAGKYQRLAFRLSLTANILFNVTRLTFPLCTGKWLIMRSEHSESKLVSSENSLTGGRTWNNIGCCSYR